MTEGRAERPGGDAREVVARRRLFQCKTWGKTLAPRYHEWHVPERSMKPSVALAEHRQAIRRVVASHRGRNARVFGSVVRGEDAEGSDLDLLIDPTPETTLFDIGAIRHELLQLLRVPVQVLTPNALPKRIRATVLAEAMPV